MIFINTDYKDYKDFQFSFRSDITGAALRNCKILTLKAPHRKDPEGDVLRRLVRIAAILAAEVQSAGFLWFVSFARAKEMNE